jgi:YD repeat-containing protein
VCIMSDILLSRTKNLFLLLAAFLVTAARVHGQTAPSISSLSPSSGVTGTVVTISGSNFGASPGTVTFASVSGTPTAWSNTSITVTVPSLASTGPVVVTAGTLSSGGVNFTVIPQVSSISPTTGGPNAFVTISGTGFGSTIGTSTVAFNGVGAQPQSWSVTSVLVPVPAGISSGPVVLTVGGNSSNGVAFTYAPSGSISGTISRASDGSPLSNAFVQALQSGLQKGSATSAIDGTYSIGSLSPGVYDVSATASGFLNASQTSNLIVAANPTTVNVAMGVPTISGVSPGSGPATLSVTISGSFFGSVMGSSSVTFNGVSATPTSWGNTRIVVPVPTSATTGPVIVTVAGIASNSVTFTVGTGSFSGSITRTSDGSAVSGALIEILQSNQVKSSTSSLSDGSYTVSSLTPSTYDLRISASGLGTALQNNKSVTAGGSTTVNATLPAATAITGTITKSDGITAISGATVTALQSSDTVATTTSDASGNYNLATVAPGTYTVQASAVGYNAKTQTSVVVSAGVGTTQNFSLAGQSTINYSFDAVGRLTGVVDSQGSAAAYSYDSVGNLLGISNNPSSQVSISGFTPISGGAGQTVAIHGTAFGSNASLDTVTFNGSSATVVSATATALTVTVPTGATTGPISVTAPAGTATSASSFTVASSLGSPSISSFTPSVATPGTAITVTGSNFDIASNDRTTLNVSMATVSSATSSSIATTVPKLATTGHVSVSTPAGKATSAAFLFVPPPSYTVANIGFTGSVSIGGSPISVSIGTAHQVGLVAFDASKGQQVFVNMTSSTFGIGNVTINLLRPDGTTQATICCGASSFDIDTQTVSVTGTYTLLVVPQGTSVGSVAVQVLSSPGLQGTITENGPPVNVTTTAGQNQSLTFFGTAAQHVSINLTGSTYPFGNLNVSLLRPDGTTQGTICCGNSFLDAQTLPISGTYTILVDPQGASTGSVSVQLYAFNMLTGTITPNGAAVPVTTTYPGQNETLTFSGTAGQIVSVNLTSSTYSFGNLNVSLLRPDGSTQATVCCGGTFLDAQTLATTGTYTILVDPQGAATGSVSVNLYQFTMLSGTITINGSAVPVSTTVPGQNETLTFSGTAGQTVSISLSSSTYPFGTLNFSLKKPDGSTQASGCCGGLSISSQTLATTGTYSILIDPQGASTGGVTVTLTSP